MLGIEVPRLKLASIVVLALLTAGQLALHHHSLVPEAGTAGVVCGVCTFSADRVVDASPAGVVLPFHAAVPALPECAFSSVTRLAFTTRGPPRS